MKKCSWCLIENSEEKKYAICIWVCMHHAPYIDNMSALGGSTRNDHVITIRLDKTSLRTLCSLMLKHIALFDIIFK